MEFWRHQRPNYLSKLSPFWSVWNSHFFSFSQCKFHRTSLEEGDSTVGPTDPLAYIWNKSLKISNPEPEYSVGEKRDQDSPRLHEMCEHCRPGKDTDSLKSRAELQAHGPKEDRKLRSEAYHTTVSTYFPSVTSRRLSLCVFRTTCHRLNFSASMTFTLLDFFPLVSIWLHTTWLLLLPAPSFYLILLFTSCLHHYLSSYI